MKIKIHVKEIHDGKPSHLSIYSNLNIKLIKFNIQIQIFQCTVSEHNITQHRSYHEEVDSYSGR